MRRFRIRGRTLEVPRHCLGCEGIEDKARPRHHPTLELTQACNLRCPFCYSEISLKRGVEIKPGLYFNGRDEFEAVTISQYGEPVLVGISKLGSYSKWLKDEIGAERIDLHTNGVILGEGSEKEVEEKLEYLYSKGIDMIIVSLHSVRRYSEVTRGGKEDLEKVLRLLSVLGDSELYSVIRTVILPGVNLDEMKSLNELAKEKGIDELMVQPLVIYPDSTNALLEIGVDLERVGLLEDLFSIMELEKVKMRGCLLYSLEKMQELGLLDKIHKKDCFEDSPREKGDPDIPLREILV